MNNASDRRVDVDLFHRIALRGLQVLLEDRLRASGAVVPEDVLFLERKSQLFVFRPCNGGPFSKDHILTHCKERGAHHRYKDPPMPARDELETGQ